MEPFGTYVVYIGKVRLCIINLSMLFMVSLIAFYEIKCITIKTLVL